MHNFFILVNIVCVCVVFIYLLARRFFNLHKLFRFIELSCNIIVLSSNKSIENYYRRGLSDREIIIETMKGKTH